MNAVLLALFSMAANQNYRVFLAEIDAMPVFAIPGQVQRLIDA